MYHLITIIAYIFDLFIIASFMNDILGKRRSKVTVPIFIICLIFAEAIIYMNEKFTTSLSNDLSLIVTVFISLLTTFGLTLLYSATMWHRVFVTVSFQILVLLGESFFTLAIQKINPSIFEINESSLVTLMNFGSKVVLYLLVLLCNLFWNRRMRKYNTIQYNALLFSTPLISLIIMLNTPLKDILESDNQAFFLLLFISLTLLNIVNYLLLERVFSITELDIKYNTMEQQMQYQKDKYIQLGAAYKSNRSFLHDTKKHYFAISEYIKHKEYDKLQEYLHISMEKMESSYTSINTGNLVIDSFVSNFKTIAKNNSISFKEDISVDANRIPINDYDLCIILGNLLDNSLNACNKITHSEKNIQLNIYTNDNDTFLIHTSNSYINSESGNETIFDGSFEHGYGLDNIQKIVESNHGIFKCSKENNFDVLIIIPIIDIKKRLHPPIINRDLQ